MQSREGPSLYPRHIRQRSGRAHAYTDPMDTWTIVIVVLLVVILALLVAGRR